MSLRELLITRTLIPDRRSFRRVAAGTVLGALVALVVVTLQGGPSEGGSRLFIADNAAGPSHSEPLHAPVHSCLTWQQPDASDARVVDCAEAHLFEVTAVVELNDFGTQAPFPGEVSWSDLVSSRCIARTTEALDGHFDPFGRFTVGAIKPSADTWRHGDRTLRCGVQTAGRSGILFPTTGGVLEQDQADVHEPGTCLGNDGKAVGDPIDCAKPHAVEVVGVVQLHDSFPDGYPDEAAQDKTLETECTRLAADYAGGPDVVADKKLTLFWETLRAESWQAGSTKVDCRLGTFLPDRSGFAPVTGSVREQVEVGTEPAPPAPKNPGLASEAVQPAEPAPNPDQPAEPAPNPDQPAEPAPNPDQPTDR